MICFRDPRDYLPSGLCAIAKGARSARALIGLCGASGDVL
jgi:hypothetical protein